MHHAPAVHIPPKARLVLPARTGCKFKPTNENAFVNISTGLIDIEQRVGEDNLDSEDEELNIDNSSDSESVSESESDDDNN